MRSINYEYSLLKKKKKGKNSKKTMFSQNSKCYKTPAIGKY